MGNTKLAWLVLAVPAWITGCATAQGISSPEDAQIAMQSRWVGRTIGEAVSVYGVPDGQTKIKGHTVHIWRRVAYTAYGEFQCVLSIGTAIEDGSRPNKARSGGLFCA